MTTVETTQRDVDESGTPRVRARGRLRDWRPQPGKSAASASALPPSRTATARTWLTERGEQLAATQPLQGRPASVAQVWARTRAGGFIPGEHSVWWEMPGYAYGFGFAVPATAVLNAGTWVLQEFHRVAFVALLVLMLFLVW